MSHLRGLSLSKREKIADVAVGLINNTRRFAIELPYRLRMSIFGTMVFHNRGWLVAWRMTKRKEL